MANHMSEIDGGYPRGLSGCFIVGINGGCGITCPVFLDFECENADGFCKEDIELCDELDEEQREDLIDYYFN